MEIENGDPNSNKMEDYQVIEQIGKGSFTATFLVLHKTENKKYVLKEISLSKQTDKFKRTVHQEINLVAKLRHPYLVEFKDAWVDAESYICIITNYCDRGDMSQIVRRARGAYFPEEVVCKWLTQMLLAIDYLHSNRVHHRDLKLSNIFVTKENDIRLGDFGLSRLFDEEGVASSVVGNPTYMLPEVVAGAPYGYKSDIWSLGCCIFEIAARQQAFKASDMTGLINKINRSLISPLPIVYSATLKQMIKSMLRKSPEHRPNAAELLRHPHLQPFLLRCHDLSPTFLPVKSPSPKNASNKKVKASPSTSSSGSKKEESREKVMKPKPKELLPLFDEIKDTQVPSLLDSDLSIDDILETKRVDPTSYSGKMSTDSEEDSKTSSGTGDDESNACSSSITDASAAVKNGLPQQRKMERLDEQELSANKLVGSEACGRKNGIIATAEPQCSSSSTTGVKEDAIPDKCSAGDADDALRSTRVETETVGRCDQSNAPSTGVPMSSNNTEKAIISAKIQDAAAKLFLAQGAGAGDGSKSKKEKPAPQRADALESLLELCADLLKQDKLDELTGILKPFGDETVSSRETAIWLTKSLMNAKKMAKNSSS